MLNDVWQWSSDQFSYIMSHPEKMQHISSNKSIVYPERETTVWCDNLSQPEDI